MTGAASSTTAHSLSLTCASASVAPASTAATSASASKLRVMLRAPRAGGLDAALQAADPGGREAAGVLAV